MKQADLYRASIKATDLHKKSEQRSTLASALLASEKSETKGNAAFSLVGAIVSTNCLHEAWAPALQLLVYSRLRELDAALEAEGVVLEGDKIYPPGVTYSSDPGRVHITGEVAEFLRVEASRIQAGNGSWQITRDGGFELSGGAECALPQALPSKDMVCLQARVMQLETQVSTLASVLKGLTCGKEVEEEFVGNLLKPQGVPSEGYEFNNPEDLPPVGSVLLIKVPAGTQIDQASADSLQFGCYILKEDTVFSAFRTRHLSNRNQDMEYRLSDDSTVTGKFRWTYP